MELLDLQQFLLEYVASFVRELSDLYCLSHTCRAFRRVVMRSNGTMTHEECNELLIMGNVSEWPSMNDTLYPENIYLPTVESELRWLSVDCIGKDDPEYRKANENFLMDTRGFCGAIDVSGNPIGDASWFRAPNGCFPAYTNAAILLLLEFLQQSRFWGYMKNSADTVIEEDRTHSLRLGGMSAFVPELATTWVIACFKSDIYNRGLESTADLLDKWWQRQGKRQGGPYSDRDRKLKASYEKSLRRSMKLGELEVDVARRMNLWYPDLALVCEKREPFDYDSWSELWKRTTVHLDRDMNERRKKDIKRRQFMIKNMIQNTLNATNPLYNI